LIQFWFLFNRIRVLPVPASGPSTVLVRGIASIESRDCHFSVSFESEVRMSGKLRDGAATIPDILTYPAGGEQVTASWPAVESPEPSQLALLFAAGLSGVLRGRRTSVS